MSLLHKNVFGLDISDFSIEAVKLKKSMGKIKLESYSRFKLSPGIVENGIIHKKEALTKAIIELLNTAQPKPLKCKNVILSLPESRVFTHIFRLPANLKREQVKEVIQYQAEEVIPLTFDQIDFNFQVITREEKYQEIFYAACAKSIISDYREVIENVGLAPTIFDIESAALARSLVRGNPFEGALIADIGARTTILSIFDHNGIRWSVNIPVAGNKFTDLIAKKLKIPAEIAEDLKRNNGLDPNNEKGRVLEILKPALEDIISETKKSINYYEKSTKYSVTKIILCGGSAQMPQIKEYFQSKLKTIVEIGDPLSDINYDKKIFDAKRSVMYSNVIGLALRAIEKEPLEAGINLLSKGKMAKLTKEPAAPKIKAPAQKISMGKNKRQIILLIIFLLLVAVFLGLYFWQKLKKPQVVSYVSNTNTTTTKPTIQQNIALEFPIQVNTKTSENLASGIIPGRVLEKTLEKSKTFQTTGVKSIPDKATGQATIFNNYSANQPLVATTRLLSKDGVLYRLKEGAVVPAKSQITVDISADQPGKEYEIGPTEFTIPGLSASLQKLIYAKSDKPTAGGIKEIKILSQQDLDNAQADLKKELAADSLSSLTSELKEAESLMPIPLSEEIMESKASKKLDTETNDFTLTLKIKNQLLAFQKNDVTNTARDELAKKITDTQKVEDYTLAEPAYILNNYNTESGLVSLTIKIEAKH